MTKTLVIAEKPSVAADIARALGGFTRHGDYFESDRYIVSSAIGHLLEIGMPEDEEVKRGKWTFAQLPAIPTHFALKPIAKTEDRLKVLLKLIKRKDVGEIVNACDAGREGELIFRYIMQYAKTPKPVRRLWLQSMTAAAIREGFGGLRSDDAMQPLADAATCRSESDWLVGINGTRAMTAFNSKAGGFQLTTVGRVQTPTLAILVDRESKIRSFVPRDYFEVHARFKAKAGEYTGKWFDEGFRKRDDDAEARADRLWDIARANEIAAACAGGRGTVSEESKPSTQASPLLYDLTSLQREANSRFGFSARTTLSLAQALYERHKALTYPRTDARALPEDYPQTVKATMEVLSATNAYGGFARKVLKEQWVRPNKRIFDNSKISDHFAIIPTPTPPKQLNEAEQKLYDMVVRRFLAIFFPAAEYLTTTRITRVAREPFRSEGKILVSPGWLAVYGREVQGDDAMLVKVEPNEQVTAESIDVVKLVTRPPPRFNEGTLLSAMEGAGRLIEDDELREAMREKGLGTPATRAQIIEGLILERYVHREGKELIPTAKAFSLMTLLHGLGIPELFSPELTAEWEHQLANMEHGRLKRPEFMRGIVKMTKRIVAQAKNYESDTIPGDFATLSTPCAKCGGEVHERYKKFQCIACDFGFWKIMGGRQLVPAEAETLLREREVGPLDGFRSRLGRAFSAKLKLTDGNEVQFDFGQGDEDSDEAPDFSGQASLGSCPKCRSFVFEMPNAYVCERAVGPERSCDFRSGRTILSRTIERPQMEKLLESGRTDLMQFVSARTKRPFNAYLVRQPDGKVGFEFEPRGEGARTRPQRGAAPLRVVGKHPADGAPIELFAGRYGPYVKHAGINATVPDRNKLETLTMEEALALLVAKGGKPATAGKRPPARAASVQPTAAVKRAVSSTTRSGSVKKTSRSQSRTSTGEATRSTKLSGKRTPQAKATRKLTKKNRG
ncbi:MAG TPA: DNA topoisomerase III [Casimicrobiaceae bacterium]|nr:DNA topoisomerase III [Casimicrobiaceae bacterium]